MFLIDTHAYTAAPVTTMQSQVLSLTVDQKRSLLWISTPSSSQGAWNLPEHPAMEAAPSIDVAGENNGLSRQHRGSNNSGGGVEATSALDSPYMPPQPSAGANFLL